MYIKFIQRNYDIPNEEGYYLLKLNNNPQEDNQKIIDMNELLPNKGFHISKVKTREVTNKGLLPYQREPLKIYGDNKQNILLYKDRKRDAIPIIGEYKNGVMKDVLTGTIYSYSPNNDNSSISFAKCIKIPSKIVIDVLKNITINDLQAYSEAILSIKNNSDNKQRVK